jgi:hypothetical protein
METLPPCTGAQQRKAMRTRIHTWICSSLFRPKIELKKALRAQWLTPIILATKRQCSEDHSSKPAWANSSWDPISKRPITKQDWQSGLSGGTPAWQVWGPEFKLQYGKKKKKKKKKRKTSKH